MKKKVCKCFNDKCPDLHHKTLNVVFYLLWQLDQAVDGVSGETDWMLSSQVTQSLCVTGHYVTEGGDFWVTSGTLYFLFKTGNQLNYTRRRKTKRC